MNRIRAFCIALCCLVLADVATYGTAFAESSVPTSEAARQTETVQTLFGQKSIRPLAQNSMSCGVGMPKRTEVVCGECPVGYRKVREKAQCTQATDEKGQPCGSILCETCACQPN